MNRNTRDVTAGRIRRAWRSVAGRAMSGWPRSDLGSEKVISAKYRFICLCVPKVASRSLITALRMVDEQAEVLALPIADVYRLRPEAERYFSFALLRHPFTRTISWYRELFFAEDIYSANYHHYRGNRGTTLFDAAADQRVRLRGAVADIAAPDAKRDKRERLLAKYRSLAEVRTFEDVCVWLHSRAGRDAGADRHFLSQHVQTRLPNGRPPQRVGRFENIDADLAGIAARIGMPVPALPLLNTMAGWQAPRSTLAVARSRARTELNDRCRALLRRRYAGDFALGGY